MGRLGRWVWLLLALGLLLRLAIVFRPFPWVDDLVLCDDSYLCWDIARRWAGGHPMTQDGIHFTNGFQPLWIFLLIPVYALFPADPILPGRIALVLLALLNVATGVFLFRIAKEVASTKGGYFALFLWMASSPVIVQGINGMETALVIMLMAVTLWYYLTRVRDRPYSWQGFLGLGLLAGLTMLARLDQVFLLLALGLDVLWQRRKRALGPLVLMGLGAVAMLSPWLLLSLHYTGSPIPVSGRAVRFLSLAELQWREIPGWRWNFKMFRYALGQWAGAPLPLVIAIRSWDMIVHIHRRILFAGVALLICLFLWLLWRRVPIGDRQRAGRLLFLGVFAAGMLGLYAFYIYTYWYLDRYQAPMALVATLGYGVLYAWSPRWVRQALWALALLLLIPGLWKMELGEPHRQGYHRIADYIREAFPPGTRLGTYQSGAMGYFARDKVVINLDGVVNAEALEAHQENRAFDYIRDHDIAFLLDWDQLFEPMLFRHSGRELSEGELVCLGRAPGVVTISNTWTVYQVMPKEERSQP